jgi:hypothetical protein
MASSYSPLKIELISTGEQSGTWGATTNNNLEFALSEAITGSADVAFSSADVTVTLTNTNAAQTARNLRLNLTGTSGGARELILGSGCQIEKLYLINNTLADPVTVKNTTGTGIAVPAGTSMFVFNTGANVVIAESNSGGARIASSGTDVTLTTGSTKVQQISMTAVGLAVILPSTTGYATSTVGTPIFVITNAGSNYFDIENSAGNVIFGVSPGETCTISLTGNTTQTQWIGSLVSNTVISSVRGVTGTISTTVPNWAFPATQLPSQNIQVVGLSSVLVLAVWTNSTTSFTFAAAGSIAGSTITWGTPTSISSIRAYNKVTIAALSTTTALIGGVAPTGNAYFNGVSISGTTITVSTISSGTTVSANTSTQFPLIPLTSTTALFVYPLGGGSNINHRVITYNGASAPTLGTAVADTSSTGLYVNAVGLDSTNVLCFSASDDSGGFFNARVSSVSGTTVTFGTNLSLTNFPSSGAGGSAIKISSTEAIFTWNNPNSNLYVQRFTVAGTTITASTSWVGQAYKVLNQNSGANYLLSATDFLATSGPTTAPAFARYSYNASTGVTLVGTSSFPVTITAFGYGYVASNIGVVVGLNSAGQICGYLVSLA